MKLKSKQFHNKSMCPIYGFSVIKHMKMIVWILGWYIAPSFSSTPAISSPQKSSYRLQAGDRIELLCLRNNIRADSVYRLQPDDMISIQFPSLPNYSTDLTVLSDGTICIPRCEPVKISGMTISEIKDTLTKTFMETGWNPEFFLLITKADQKSQQILDWFKRAVPGSLVYQVRLDGFVSLPFVGDIVAAGKTLTQFIDVLNSSCTQYPGVSFDIVLIDMAESDIYVFGEVRNPGVFTVKNRVSLLHAISLAGGFTPQARELSTFVIRTVDDTVFVNRVDSRIRSKKDSVVIGGPQYALRYLQPGSIVFVPRKKLFKLSDYMSAIRNILAFQGFGLGFHWSFGYEWRY